MNWIEWKAADIITVVEWNKTWSKNKIYFYEWFMNETNAFRQLQFNYWLREMGPAINKLNWIDSCGSKHLFLFWNVMKEEKWIAQPAGNTVRFTPLNKLFHSLHSLTNSFYLRLLAACRIVFIPFNLFPFAGVSSSIQ